MYRGMRKNILFQVIIFDPSDSNEELNDKDQ